MESEISDLNHILQSQVKSCVYIFRTKKLKNNQNKRKCHFVNCKIFVSKIIMVWAKVYMMKHYLKKLFYQIQDIKKEKYLMILMKEQVLKHYNFIKCDFYLFQKLFILLECDRYGYY